MQEIYIGDLAKVLNNKIKLEKSLEVKLTNKGKNIFIKGDAEKEYIASKVMEAINYGLSVKRALLLKQEGLIFQTLNIKDITKRHDLERVKARIIGIHGKTIRTLSELTDCAISLKDNKIGIIGDTEKIKDAVQALTSLICGSRQGNVYARLEKQKKKKRLSQTKGF